MNQFWGEQPRDITLSADSVPKPQVVGGGPPNPPAIGTGLGDGPHSDREMLHRVMSVLGSYCVGMTIQEIRTLYAYVRDYLESHP